MRERLPRGQPTLYACYACTQMPVVLVENMSICMANARFMR